MCHLRGPPLRTMQQPIGQRGDGPGVAEQLPQIQPYGRLSINWLNERTAMPDIRHAITVDAPSDRVSQLVCSAAVWPYGGLRMW